MTHADRPTIETSALALRYDGRAVLDQITLAVPAGAVVGLVGRNGAGKSTLLPWLTVWQHVEYIGSFYPRWEMARAVALSDRLGLAHKTKVSSLSVGEQQKLALVLALAHDPDLLLLDEPVASLDPLARRDFMRLMFEGDAARAAPRTVLLSSHLLSDLERVVSHVIFLREGRVHLQGAWDDLLEQHGCSLEDLFVTINAPAVIPAVGSTQVA